MRLLVVSDMAHYQTPNGVVGWGPTVEEISYLARLFDEVVHIGCLHRRPAPPSSLPYACANLRFVPLRPAGGPTVMDKLAVLRELPRYAWRIARELPRCDAVHLRAPAHSSLMAMLLLAVRKRPTRRWIKYAGDWSPKSRVAVSYRFQRWWLAQGFSRAQVTVNGRWPGQPPHVHTFPNPCLSKEEWQRAVAHASAKGLHEPVQLFFAGALTPNKQPELALATLGCLLERGVDARLAVAGDGTMRRDLQRQADVSGVAARVTFLGFLPRPALGEYYQRAHFVVLCSRSEGWPKVLAEGMSHGAVPIASAVGSIPQVLAEAACGRALDSFDPNHYAEAILAYLSAPERWYKEKEAGCRFAERFTYEAHRERVRKLLDLPEKNQ